MGEERRRNPIAPENRKDKRKKNRRWKLGSNLLGAQVFMLRSPESRMNLSTWQFVVSCTLPFDFILDPLIGKRQCHS